MIVLYSTNCPKCKVLEKKLQDANIDFTINNDVSEMVAMGFMEAPILKANEKFMNFKEAVDWIGAIDGN